MSKKVTFDYSKANSFISAEEVSLMKKLTLDAKEVLVSKEGAGNDFSPIRKGQKILQHAISPDFQIQGGGENTIRFNEAVGTGVVPTLGKLCFG